MTKLNNPFTLQPSEYVRGIDVVTAYHHDTATLLMRHTGKTYEQCLHFVKSKTVTVDGLPLNDPATMYLSAATRGNRKLYEGTFTSYLEDIKVNNRIVAPNMTTYRQPSETQSISALWIKINKDIRAGYKKMQLQAKVEGDGPKQAFATILQTLCKVKNNSVSGAHASPYTVLYNKSSHSTLTSSCRVATSYANANNEKLLMGNRHYWSPDVVINNILTLTSRLNEDDIACVVKTYSIHIPSVTEVMSCITRSSDLYWVSTPHMDRIQTIVERLSDMQKCYFLYTSDLYHLAFYNPALIRTFITRFIEQPTYEMCTAESVGYLKLVDDDTKILAKFICSDLLVGIKFEDVASKHPKLYAQVEETAYRIQQTLDDYSDFISMFLRPNQLPTSVAKIPAMIRKAVPTSDTDSTIFTTMYWTKWITGSINFEPTSFKVGYTITYLASKTVMHILAMMSANMGVTSDKIHELQMKNEYYFPVFSLTNLAKHYYGVESAQEGVVFDKMRLDVKGVNLRNSASPPSIMLKLREYIRTNIDLLMNNGVLSIDDILKPIYDIELDIIDNIRKGGYKYLKSTQIKSAESYIKKEDASARQYDSFWQECMSHKYGNSPEAPYAAIKISLDLDNKTKVEEWLTAMDDKVVSAKIKSWLDSRGKSTLASMQIPRENSELHGLPIELAQAMKLRKLIMDLMRPFYIVLETYGLYISNSNVTHLVSDTYKPPIESLTA